MRPLRLQIKNFLSYREPPPLDLRGMQVVCLSGNNGHGKSALLDAITWALWGECSRGGGQTNDSLVHRGQADMAVDLEFAQDGRVYRVRRLYQKAGGPRRASQHRLSLQVQVDPDLWRDISGNSVAETQKRITTLLGMDYDAFVHTAYLLQGQADLFSRVAPQERRRLLARILGLDLYEHAREVVKGHLRTLQGRAEALSEQIERLQPEVARKPAVEAALAQARQDLASATDRLDALQREVDALRQQEQDLQRQQRQQEEWLRQAQAWEEEAQEWENRAKQAERQIQEMEAILQRREDILQGQSRYQQVARRLEALEQAREEHDRLSRAIADAEKAIAAERARLEARLDELRKRLHEAQSLASTIPALEEALARLPQDEATLAEHDKQVQALQDEVDRLQAEASAHTARAEHAQREMQALQQRLDLLASQPDPLCPLCKTPLGAQAKAHLEQEMAQRKEALRREYDTAQSAARQAREQAEQKSTQRDTLRKQVEQKRRSLEAQRASLQKDLENARQAQRSAQEWDAEARTLQERLAQGAFAPDHHARLAQARQALQALGYDPALHQAIREEAKALQPVLQEAERLAQAECHLPRLRADVESYRQSIQKRLQDAQRAREQARQAQEDLQRLPALQATLQKLGQEQKDLQKELDTLTRKVGALEQDLRTIAQAKAALDARQREHDSLQTDLDAYAALERAFAPQGIPTRIVESVVHDLSDTATEILQRLTNGQMALRVETARLTKSGDLTDALEVRIDDGTGERLYESFSGGERFRIDFALRLALSKLLAQTSGHAVRTLFIDEGFGTQDAEGRARLLEAIQAIHKDFDLIIVITHMDDMKEHFPTRIEVTRTPHGSWYEVVETG
ncbi:MAG: SMC family ATPase [Chloroflexota bacterium]|nr:SMC family ATPase [Chloroflexota bacterium]